MHRWLRFTCTWLLATPLLLATVARAESESDKDEREAAEQLRLGELQRDLKSGDEKRMRAALARISGAGPLGKFAAPLVDDLLTRGTSEPLLQVALDLAGQLGQTSSSPAVARYLRHRSPGLRLSAARALSRTGGAVAASSLRMGLRSQDPELRRACAIALGQVGARDSVPDLLVALTRGIGEAAPSIGMLCGPKECRKLMQQLGKLDFEVVTQGLAEVLFRSPQSLPDEVKLEIVNELGKQGTTAVVKFLSGVARQWPTRGQSEKVKRAIDQIVGALDRPEEGP